MNINTIRRSLAKLNIFAYRLLNKSFLSKINIERRKEIAGKWLCEAETYFDDVIFSDECKFNLYSSDENTFIWRESFERLSPEYVISTVKYEEGIIMVLA